MNLNLSRQHSRRTMKVIQSAFRQFMSNYTWLKVLLFTGFLFTNISIAAKSIDTLMAAGCEGDACETPSLKKPAYSMSIVTYGEGEPAGDNLSEESLQKNRRVDVSITGVPEPESSVQTQHFVGGGVIWATTDPLALDRQLEITTPRSVALVDGVMDGPVKLRIYSNYSAFLKRWEVLIYRAGDDSLSDPVATLSGDRLGLETELEWNGVLSDGNSVAPGDQLQLVLRVFDSADRVDETFAQPLEFLGPDRHIESDEEFSIAGLALEQRRERNQLARQEILLRGSRVRLYGRDLDGARQVMINGESITLDEQRQFVTEYILREGDHDFNVEVTDRDGNEYDRKLAVEVDNEYMFIVALADVTLGKNTVSGNVDGLDVDDDHYGGDIFIDGRLAFYLKGKIKGKYLVTAQMDTGSNDLEHLFDDIHRKDPSGLFRRLDPDQYYPVYGDDSTVTDDTDSQGKLYVRVDWDHSQAVWGNFNSGVTGTEFAQFNRTLYGAQLTRRSNSFTVDGEHRTDINLFASEAQSAHRHNEFIATGGSLYYLKDRDIVKGSEKAWVEIRQSDTDRVIERIDLQEGRDYQIDDFQGRMILNRPLQGIGLQAAPSIIKDQPLDGNDVWLVVDYEYVPDDFDSDHATVGARGKHWLNDKLAVGGTWVLERRGNGEHEIKGIDATLKKNEGTWVRAEYAQSNSSQTLGSFRSNDGGLNFQPFNSNATGNNSEGFAAGVEARADLQETFSLDRPSNAEAWFKFRDKGFAASGFDNGYETIDSGFDASMEISDRFELSAGAKVLDKRKFTYLASASLRANYDVTQRVTLGAELKQVEQEDDVVNTRGQGTLGAVRLGIDVNDKLNIFAVAQATIASSGSYDDNNLLTLGARSKAGNRLTFNAEASTGDRGDSLLAGATLKVNSDYGLYTNQSLSTDSTRAFRNATTVGQRYSVNKNTRLYTEHQFTDEDQRSGLGHTFGVDYNHTRYTTLSASVQSANFEDDAGGTTDRDAVSAGLAYKRSGTHASTRLEYRHDKSATTDTDQWVTTNSFNYAASASLRWQGKFNYSTTEDNVNGGTDATYTEAGIGFALRPVTHDRLNMLGRLTWLHDLPPSTQSNTTDERSLVGSMELSYLMSRLWEVGGKVAYKESEIRTSRDSGDWLDNDAMLLATRLRYHLIFKWDALAEYHWLHSKASDDTQHGMLFSVGRHVGDHLKLAVGYNFTRFDDNLLNESGDAGGWFINLVGKY